MIWSFIGSIGGKVLDIVDDVVEDKNETNHVKLKIQHLGHTITAVFDPNAITETGFISCFVVPQEAAEFLTYKARTFIIMNHLVACTEHA